MKPTILGTFALAAMTAVALAGVSGPAIAQDAKPKIKVCAQSMAAVAAKAIITVYTAAPGQPEQRSSTGWRTMTLGGDPLCVQAEDLQAFNVTIEGWTTKWEKGCDVNRRPAENLIVVMRGSAFSLSCTTS
ncbi:MAG TPA: hypothetical protein VD995_02080 [Azospirillum sp.]|nr:hypothetical protein [Azospirillum sp.]